MAGVVRGRANAPDTGMPGVARRAMEKEEELHRLGEKETEGTRFRCSTTFCRLSLKRNAHAPRDQGNGDASTGVKHFS